MDPISNEEDFYEKCNKPEEFKRLLFCLCFFHAVIQERRLFGPLGWNIPYEFTENDLRISCFQLAMFLDEAPPNEIPVKALVYLTGECNYGGRVTDDKDRRLMMILLGDFYCNEAACNENHPVCPEHGEYVVPTSGNLESAIEHIRNFPMVTPPGIFGFHENANLTKFQNETYKMMDNLLLTMAQSSSGGASSPESTVGAVSADILRRMPEPWKLDKVQHKYPTQYTESMNTVLLQELTRFNKLINIVLSTLKDIQKAIKGLLLMSSQLEGAFMQMYDGKTPAMWLASSYPSLKPLGSYVSDLLDRLKFFQAWVDDGIPVLFWMSGNYFTQAFTTGAAQNFARKYTIPIDTLTFDFEFPKEQDPKEKPADGVFTNGAFLEGAKWDWEKWEISESDPKVLFVSVPLVWIIPCKKSDVKETPHYTCPMYKISSRRGTLSTTGHSTNFVMFINVPSSVTESHWTKRGVAMLTQLDT
jgi:dynein heavy chain